MWNLPGEGQGEDRGREVRMGKQRPDHTCSLWCFGLQLPKCSCHMVAVQRLVQGVRLCRIGVICYFLEVMVSLLASLDGLAFCFHE